MHATLRRDLSAIARRLEGPALVLFAMIRRPWTMIFSPFTTDVRDYSRIAPWVHGPRFWI